MAGKFFSDDVPIPADESQLGSWFNDNVKPLAARKDTLDPALVAAEMGVKVIKVMLDGTGDYKSVAEAVKNVPSGNKTRIIIWIGGGVYYEKITVESDKPFVTFYGSPSDMPMLVFDDTRGTSGGNTPNSATLTVSADYFVAVNLIVKNSAPRPVGRPDEQAVAMAISGDKASFYNCKFLGFQDTLLDYYNKHFFKDCYIEGTVDFIFGFGKSLYLNTEIHVVPGDNEAYITAEGRDNLSSDGGFSFVHCKITGSGKIAYFGRAWKPNGSVLFAYCDIDDVINPAGWSDDKHPSYIPNLFYAEYNNKYTGDGGRDLPKRVNFAKMIKDEAEITPFLTLGYIQASKWLLPPITM